MKRLLLLSLILTALVSCKSKPPKGANGVEYKSAVQYNDYIVSRQSTLMKNIMSFVDVAQSDLDSAEVLLDNNVKQIETMIGEIKGMPAYNGDSALRDAAAGIFGFYKKIFDKDYRDILHIRKGADGFSAEADSEIAKIVSRIEEEEKGFDSRFQGAQKVFARKNNMKLVDNEMQKEFDDKMKTSD